MSDQSSTTYTGAILAGGQSRRMGQPKEGVVMPDGRRMIEPIIKTLSDVCKRIVIVGACRGFSIPPESGLLHLQDADPGMGPLAAIRTLLTSGIDPQGYIIMACDQPFVTTALLGLLMTGDPHQLRLLKQKERLSPFPGYYPISWRVQLDQAFQNGERSICHLLQTSDISSIPFPEARSGHLKNINTPEDLKQSDL